MLHETSLDGVSGECDGITSCSRVGGILQFAICMLQATPRGPQTMALLQ